MSVESNDPVRDPVMNVPERSARYTVELVAQLSGVSSQTIMQYREQGLISAVAGQPEESIQFNDEALRALRRIEHLREACEMNASGLKLVLTLLDEIERLQTELRSRL